ncbi:hypothetical protein D8B26_004729 [Coccidioides posadasii str. Silveira]|uniref:Uncharacterized protein n=1 Tax=Coccidioides posadasii (strain RMSCC 757 / Silveira) TaxID=443226 RepID=E9D6T2_COCPS|nr:conserved hypothetical protein [Coccidioides posadasii str. Silveira]QVM10066.1 hypothetical protein D8B26_004729 [Coccidioides posadasii str. Silveira]
MRAILSTLLVSLVSLASLEQCQALDTPHGNERPQYYFPRRIKREIHRESPLYVKREVVVIPVTVMLGPDGKKTTLGANKVVGMGTQPTAVTSATTISTGSTDIPGTTPSDPDNPPVPTPSIPSTTSVRKIPGTSPGSRMNNPETTARPSESTGPTTPAASVTTPVSSSPSDDMEEGISIDLSRIISGIPMHSTGLVPNPTMNSNSPNGSAPTTGPVEPTTDVSATLPSQSGSLSSQSLEPSMTRGTGGIGLPSLPPIPPVNDTISSLSMSLPTASLSIDPITTPGIPMSSQILPPNDTSTVEPSGSATQIPGSSTTTSDLIPEFPTLIPPSVTEMPIGSGTGVRPRPTNTASNGEHSTPSGSATSATGSESQPTATPSATGTSTIPSGIFPPSGSGSGSGSGILRPTTTSGKGSATETASQTMSITTSDMASPTPAPPSTKSPVSLSTNSETEMSIPTSIVVQPTQTNTETTTESQRPTERPKVISPPPNEDKTPPNSVVVNLGFNGSLSYDFVVDHSGATTQIFYFLPMGVAYALEIPNESVKVGALRPYDTVARLGYTTTVASVYIPSDLIQSLALQLRTPSSRLYNNPDPSVRTIMAMLDPTIPLTGVLSGGNGSPSNPGQNNPDQPGDDDGGNSQDTGPGPGGSGGNYNVRATSVGIGLGVVGGASLYGAAMFFVARRYRRRRRLMNEESFLTDGLGGPAGREGEPFMSGARSDGYGSSQRNSGGGTSARTQTISPPMMAENSLGWN